MNTLIQELMENQIPSIGPQTGLLLLRIMKSISEVKTPSEELKAYARTLRLITDIAILQQSAVLASLEVLIEKR